MIRAKPSAVASLRDDALRHLRNKLDNDWNGWERAGDINLVEKRLVNRGRFWVASATMIREED